MQTAEIAAPRWLNEPSDLLDGPTLKVRIEEVEDTRPRYLWHVAMTLPGMDHQAAEALRRRRYRVYRPLIPSREIRRGRIVDGVRSMFVGYLLVLPSKDGWEPLRESPGVRGLKTMTTESGERVYATLWDDDADFRRIEEKEAELWKTPNKSSKFSVGQHVQIKKGPFIDFMGHIEALDDAARVSVLIDLLKRKVRVTCSEEQLNPA